MVTGIELEVPTHLIEQLQKIFTDDSNDLKVESAKKAIAIWMLESHPDKKFAVVSIEHLQKWLHNIQVNQKFREECEQDIGWVMITFTSLFEKEGLSGIMKMATKAIGQLMMGKDPDVSSLGIDFDRIKHIGIKYAPKTMLELESKKQQND